MVSLCGLALSSLFVINNKSVVHADAANANNQNNNAISWDSDSDQAQNVQSADVQNEQNSDVQSNVQNTQAAQKVDNNQQNATSEQFQRAETSTVRSVSAAPRTTNQTAAVQSPRVANVQDAQKTSPVVINNPSGDKVRVHYVDSNGNAVDNSIHDYTIDVANTGQGSYSVPNGYSLNVPDGKYNVNGGKFSVDTLKGSVEHHVASVNYGLGKESLNELDPSLNKTLLAHANDLKAGNSWYLIMRGEWDKTFQDFCDNYYDHSYVINQLPTGNPSIESDDIDTEFYGNGSHDEQTVGKVMAKMRSFYNEQPNVAKFIPAKRSTDAAQLYEPLTLLSKTEAYDEQHLPVAFVDSSNNIVGMIQNYSGKVGTTQNISLTVPTGYKLADGVSLPTKVTFANNTNPLLVKVVPSGKTQSVTNPANNTINVKFVDQESGQQVGSSVIDLTKAQNGTNYYNVPKGYGADSGTYNTSASSSTEYNGLSAWNITGSNADNSNPLRVELDLSNDTIKSLYDYFGQDADIHMSMNVPGPYDPETVYLFNSNSSSGRTLTVSDSGSIPNWEQELYRAVVTRSDSFLGYSWSLSPDTKQGVSSHTFTDNYHTISNGTVTVPVHKTNSFSFTDNSGNAKSAQGNTVDVTLIKPQSVNPSTDTRCHSQATRTIQINFPDGQIPEAYDGIVDKSGKLVQTVHFTRTATEDALTGNILQYGNWTSDNQDPNFIGFPERTLPRIPGYTLSIKPAAANA